MKHFKSKLTSAGFTPRAIQAFTGMEVCPDAYVQTYQKVLTRLGNGTTIGFLGGRGTGKTVMATALANSVLEKDHEATVCYTTAHRLFMRYKDTYRRDSSESEMDVHQAFFLPDLLVIDEVGRRSESEWENRMLIDLGDARYGDIKDTIFISNQEKSVFDETIGDSIVSRMTDGGGCLLFNWPTFRGAQ